MPFLSSFVSVLSVSFLPEKGIFIDNLHRCHYCLIKIGINLKNKQTFSLF